MNTSNEDVWYSYIKRIDYNDYINLGIVGELSKLYSKNFGKYSDTKKRIKVSPRKFCSLHHGENAYFCSDEWGNILGFCTIDNINIINKINICIITNLVVDKKYRRKGLATSLIKFALNTNNQDHKDFEEKYVGMYTVNPISLWILENIPGLEYVDLHDDYDLNYDYNIKYAIRRFLDVSVDDDKKFRLVNDTIIQNVNGIDIYQDSKDLDEYSTDLIDWYSGLMGKLENPGSEWFLLTKIEELHEFKLDNKKL